MASVYRIKLDLLRNDILIKTHVITSFLTKAPATLAIKRRTNLHLEQMRRMVQDFKEMTVSYITDPTPQDHHIHIPGYGFWRRDIYTEYATTGKPTADQNSVTGEQNAHNAVEDIRPSLSKKGSQGTSGPNSRHYARVFEDEFNIFIPGSDFRSLPTSARDQKDVHPKARADCPKIATEPDWGHCADVSGDSQDAGLHPYLISV